MSPLATFFISTILRIVLKSLVRRHGREHAVKVVGDVLDKIQGDRETGPHDPRYNGEKTIGLLLLTLAFAGCLTLRDLSRLWPDGSGGTVPTTTTTTLPPTTTTTQPPAPPVTTVGNYQAWPLSVDTVHLTTVPAFQFEAWATKDQPAPVGAKYPTAAFWKLEEKVYGEITTTNGEQGGGFFFVCVDAKTLRKAELTIASDKKLYIYAPANPAASQYPVKPTIQ